MESLQTSRSVTGLRGPTVLRGNRTTDGMSKYEDRKEGERTLAQPERSLSWPDTASNTDPFAYRPKRVTTKLPSQTLESPIVLTFAIAHRSNVSERRKASAFLFTTHLRNQNVKNTLENIKNESRNIFVYKWPHPSWESIYSEPKCCKGL